MNAHPNATTAAGSGGASIVVVWLLGYLGLDVSAEAGAAIATLVASVALIIGRGGILGLIRVVWKGNSNGKKPKP